MHGVRAAARAEIHMGHLSFGAELPSPYGVKRFLRRQRRFAVRAILADQRLHVDCGRSLTRIAFMRIVLLTLTVSVALSASIHGACARAQASDVSARRLTAAYVPAYPLKVSTNHRFLVDQQGVPFLMVGDSPQNLVANVSPVEAATYMANRRKYGINALWVNLLCGFYNGTCNKDATTFDGVAPFTAPRDLSTPNPAYFARADEMIREAAAHGMLVLLDPIETSSWLPILRANGATKAFLYGQYLGKRYKEFPNIIWLHGNDFQTWRNSSDDAVVQAVARGIRSIDPNHLHTVELNYVTSGSLDDPSWAPLIQVDAAYTYYPTYAQVLTEYNRPNFKPVILIEANYEFEHLQNTDGGSLQNLRRQEYWTMLSGAGGQLYGSAYTWRLEKGWESKLDSPGIAQLGYMKDLFARRRWYDLVPDQSHNLVTAGYGPVAGHIGRFLVHVGRAPGMRSRLLELVKRLSGFGSLGANNCVTAAQTPDGSLMIAYLPSLRTVTVAMSRFAAPVAGHWYDPTNGKYLAVSSSLLKNAGARRFTPPGPNGAGDGDWVLVLGD